MVLRVTKWYLDLCDSSGSGVIVYAARIRWRRLRIRYTSIIEFDASGGSNERTTLRAFEEPRVESGAVHVANRRLGFSGSWAPLRDASLEESAPTTLFQDDRGEVNWQVLSNRADAMVRFGEMSGRRLEGLGYVERLEITIPPWQLPIRELRWGRIVTEGADAVWIEWLGPHPLKIVRQDGVRTSEHEFEQDQGSVLRDGPISETVLARIPILRRALPARVLQTHETKWLSRARSRVSGGEPGQSGWGIHEVVRWG